MREYEASVVVPTRDRPELVARCVDRLLALKTNRAYEVVVANDGSALPALEDPRVRVIDTGGRGPAAARNAGADAARGAVIMFTDDDALPDEGWVDAALSALENAPAAAGAEGPVDGSGFDPLYEHSIQNEQPGAYFTCNVAYRRDAFVAAGGFDLDFPTPHCEDIDLGRRVAALGPILFVPEMRVIHPPRPIGIFELALRARMIESEWRLYKKHPDMLPPARSLRLTPLAGVVRRWQRRLRDPAIVRGDPRRVLRTLALGTAQVAVALYTTLTRWRGETP